MIEWIQNYLIQSFGLDKLDTPQGILTCVFMTINTLFALLLAYRAVFLLIGCFGHPKAYPEAPKDKRYAFVLPARSEEKVIGNLIRSIRGQDYPQELIDIFVIADNCAPEDKTAEIARSLGCKVYERHEPDKQRKGYGLHYLFEQIEKDYGIESYDAYFLHDADNVLSENYVSVMNNAFHSGKSGIYQGYTTSKNFGTNIISGLHSFRVVRNIVSCDRARAFFGRGTNLVGKGMVISSDVLKNGWNYFSLAEDAELTMDYVCEMGRPLFVEDAVFFDEQPTSIKIGLRQSLRWSKGTLIVFFRYMWKMLLSIFKKPTWEKYDMWWTYFPYGLFMFLLGLTYNLVSLGLYLAGSPGYTMESFWLYLINSFVGVYVQGFLTALLIAIRERKNIYCSLGKEALYIFLFGFYDLLNIPITLLSLCMRVGWKRIPHDDKKTMDDFETEKEARQKKRK